MEVRYRNEEVVVGQLGNKVYPAPSDFEELVDISDYSDPSLFVMAPWFNHYVVAVDDLVDEYVQEDHWLPRGILFAATKTLCWSNQFCCRDRDLIVGNRRTIHG